MLEFAFELLSLCWTLEGMAKHCNMGRMVFSTHCRERINMMPMAVLNCWRLRHAARILREDSNQLIRRIAMHVGFSSSQYFARKFQERYGQSPQSKASALCLNMNSFYFFGWQWIFKMSWFGN